MRDLVEIEAFCNGFRGQNPDITLTVLRFPGIVGPQADTRPTRFLGSPVSPVLMGFDPLMQVIHEDDVVGALVLCRHGRRAGVFNVAAEGVLPLSKLRRLAGKHAPPVFHLAAYWGNPILAAFKFPVNRLWPVDLDYLRYPWVGDLAKMRHVLGFSPRYTAAEALREFAGANGPSSSDGVARARLRRGASARHDRAPPPGTFARPAPNGQEPEMIAEDIGEEVV